MPPKKEKVPFRRTGRTGREAIEDPKTPKKKGGGSKAGFVRKQIAMGNLKKVGDKLVPTKAKTPTPKEAKMPTPKKAPTPHEVRDKVAKFLGFKITNNAYGKTKTYGGNYFFNIYTPDAMYKIDDDEKIRKKVGFHKYSKMGRDLIVSKFKKSPEMLKYLKDNDIRIKLYGQDEFTKNMGKFDEPEMKPVMLNDLLSGTQPKETPTKFKVGQLVKSKFNIQKNKEEPTTYMVKNITKRKDGLLYELNWYNPELKKEIGVPFSKKQYKGKKIEDLLSPQNS